MSALSDENHNQDLTRRARAEATYERLFGRRDPGAPEEEGYSWGVVGEYEG